MNEKIVPEDVIDSECFIVTSIKDGKTCLDRVYKDIVLAKKRIAWLNIVSGDRGEWFVSHSEYNNLSYVSKKTKQEEKMTPTFPDNWDPLRSSRLFQPIQSPREKMELLKQRINQHLDQKGVINPQVRLELIKIILEDLEQFE